MRALRVLFVLVSAWTAAGCYVVSLSGLADAASTEFDERLVGRWTSADDEVELVVAADEWRTYAVTMRDRTGDQRFTARLATLGDQRLFDLTIHVGTETNPALLPVHIIGRVHVHEDEMRVQLLDYDWFRGRLTRGSLTTPATLDERDTVLLTAPRTRFRQWLTANAGSPSVFADVLVLVRDPGNQKPSGGAGGAE
jgi:hypothetical protein